MAYNRMWYETRMSKEMCDCLIKELAGADITTQGGTTQKAEEQQARDSTISWIGEGHWIHGFLWHHIMKANFTNWKYDIIGFDNGTLQLTTYGPGQYYNWHPDATIDNVAGADSPENTHPAKERELVRKLSLSMFLTQDGEDHEGGQFQIMSGPRSMDTLPAKRGQIVIFDSTMLHRVRPIKWGRRVSIVGWVVGPRWR